MEIIYPLLHPPMARYAIVVENNTKAMSKF
jgi:hypothetical protein